MGAGEILYFGNDTGFTGGIERFAYETAMRLRTDGWRVDWCGRRDGRNGALFRSGFDTVFEIGDPAAVSRNYDLVILHKLPELDMLAKLRERFGEKVVFLAHDHDLYCPRRHYYTPFGRINCRRAYSPLRCRLCSLLVSPRRWKSRYNHHTELLAELRNHHVAVLSSFMRGNLLKNGFADERIHLLPPVIEAQEICRLNEDQGDVLKILFLGQLIRGKGADLLLRALTRVLVPWQALIVGDGNDRPMLENMAECLGISERLRFTGWVKDPERLFAYADVAAFPSRWQEPFGLAGAEALGHGVPVVAFDTGGVREWLDDGVDGFVVPERNLGAFAEKLDRLGQDRDLRKKMGEAGVRIIRERFSTEHFLHAVRQLAETVKG